MRAGGRLWCVRWKKPGERQAVESWAAVECWRDVGGGVQEGGYVDCGEW